jgi:hypothetical protein
MFAKNIIDSDMFLDMSLSTQALYFHLAMRADDDGFINNPKRIQRMIGAGDDEMKILIAKQYIIPFESGVVVIKHWKIHNYIRSDRYNPSNCAEKNLVQVTDNNTYELVDTNGIPNVIPNVIPSDNQNGYRLDTQVRLGKVRLGKDSSVSEDTPTTPPKKIKKFVPPTLEEVQAYISEKRLNVDAQKFFDYYDAGSWHDGNGKAVKNWKQKCLTWDKHDNQGTLQKAKPMGNGVYKVNTFSGGDDTWKPKKVIR